MQDNNGQQQSTSDNTSVSNVPAELDSQMKESLSIWNGGAQNGLAQPPVNTNDADIRQTPPPPPEETPVITFDSLKEKFAYASPEDAIKEISELRELKNKPAAVVPEPLKFENPESEKLYAAIAKGDRKAVYSILEQQQRVESILASEVDQNNAAEIIKFGMALKYKDLNLSPEEIAHRYNKQYAIPKTPVFDENKETEEEFTERKSQWEEQVKEIQMDKVFEAKLMRKDIEAAKQSLTLPEPAMTVDEDYESWKKASQQQAASNEEIINAYKDFKPENIAMSVNFKDESNKVDFAFNYVPDEKQFKQAMDAVEDFSVFFNHFKKSDGTPDREGFLQALIFGLNRKEIIMEALNQSKNGTIKSKLPDNTQGGLIRQMPEGASPETDYVKENMNRQLAGYMPAR